MSTISNYKGLKAFNDDAFSLIDLTLDQLVESNFHIGSKLSKFEKLNFSFIFAKRFDFFILNLAYSLYNLRLAVYFLTTMVSRRGKILFFDNHELTHDLVQFIGLTSRQYYINRKWIAGLLTNFKNFYPAVFTGISRHFRFSENKYAGMRYIHRPPNVSCLLNITRGSSAFLENFRLGIPVIALVSSSNNIAGVTFPIFSNNISRHTFSTFLFILRSAILNGYKDEIYKFYRKSLKRILKKKFNLLKSKTFTKDPFFYFARYLFIKLLFIHKDIFCKFFFFVFNNLRNPFFSRIIYLFLRDLTYFYDRLVVISPNYSLHAIPLTAPQFKFDLLYSLSSLQLSDFDKFLRAFVEIFMSVDFSKFFFYFYSSLGPVCFSLFSIFFHSEYSQQVQTLSKKLSNFCADFEFIQSVFKKWFVSYSKFHFFFERQFPHEFFPFFLTFQGGAHNVSTISELPLKFLELPNRNLLFSSFRSKFFKFSMLNILYRDFKKGYWFKAFKFSKSFKRSYRMIVKRVKFLTFLWKLLYQKKNKFLTFFDIKKSKYVTLSKKYVFKNRNKAFFKSRFFTGLTIKELIRRQNLRNSYNTIMLQYFDEEYEDIPFPFNNEFFFLQVAYGNIFLTRQAERNRILASQRNSSVTVVQDRRLYTKAVLKTRSLNFSLYFPYFINIFKKI